uniref:Uncharacterized protein n=1 Tax=Arundo donax TaxID=35708 RepID=A0A0A9HSL7_ARUDO
MHPQISVPQQLKNKLSNQETSQIHRKSARVAKNDRKTSSAGSGAPLTLTPQGRNRAQIREAGER